MNVGITYTLYTKAAADERIIARGVSAVQAMRYIVERKPDRKFVVTSENYETFRSFDWSLSIDQWPTLHATVPLTTDYEGDEASALELIAIQFLRIAHRYWDGWVESDADFEERRQDGLRYAADLREAERIEREVAVNFVNLLLNDGYETVADTFGNHFVLVDSSARDDLVESFFDNLGIPEYAVTKHGAEHRFRIGSGGAANFMKTDSNAVGALIRPLVGPYVANAQSVAASGEEIENFEETSAGTQGAAR